MAEAAQDRVVLELQGRLEERRAQAASEADKGSTESKAEKPALSFELESVTCSECGNAYERTVVKFGTRRAAQPAPLCPACDKEGAAAETPVISPADALLGVLERCGVNTNQHGRCSFDTFEAEDAPVALEAAGAFVRIARAAGRHDPVRGLYLVGPTGTGKTHLAVAIAREIIAARGGDSVIFDRADRLITDLQDTYGSGRTGEYLDRRERVPVYFLDDLGSEKATDDSLRLLYGLLNAREGRATVITSNLAPGDLGERFRDSEAWARIASRLGSMNFRTVRVSGRDRRFR